MGKSTIWQRMYSEYNKWQSTDDRLGSLKKKLLNEVATYEDAQKYAEYIAREWSNLLQKYVGVDASSSEISEEISEAIEKALGQCYKNSSYYAKQVQEIINESINLKIKAVEGKIDPTRISHLLEKLREGSDVYDEILVTESTQWLIDEPIVGNVARSAITDTIMANAELHSSAGLIPYIERRPGSGGCCNWCTAMSGRYVYGEEPKDFFRVHKNCNCVITYMPSRGRWQEITYDTDKKGVRSKNTINL